MGQACFTSFNGICAEKGIHTQHRLQMQRAWGDPYASDIRVPFWNNRSMSCSDARDAGRLVRGRDSNISGNTQYQAQRAIYPPLA